MEKSFENLVQPVQESNIQEPTIQESNTLEGAHATKIAFEDQRINELEKIDQRDLLVFTSKSTSIPHIDFVIPDESKDVGSNAFMFLVLTKVVEELVQVSNIQILILQHFKIRG